MRKKPRLFLVSFVLVSLFLAVGAAPAWAASKTVQTDSSASIRPILELTVAQQGKEQIRFADVLPSDKGETKAGPIAMTLKVQSNSGERYQVTQSASGDLQNADGKTINIGNLRFTSGSLISQGTPIVSETPVTQATQTIFISDAQGTSDTLTTTYYLTVPASQAPGNYGVNITYTVSSL